MTLKIYCSPQYIKLPTRMLDKVTTESFPQKYWLRLRVMAVGKMHKGCLGKFTGMWHGNGRAVSGFDTLIMSWVNEPIASQKDSSAIVHSHFKMDIPNNGSELLGLIHVKLHSEGELSPEKQAEWEQFPEVQLNRSRNESEYKSKRVLFPYGEYFLAISVTDQDGSSVRKIFKVSASPEKTESKIRKSRFYERMLIFLKSFLAPE